jgi:hypothetical protein
LPPQPPKKSAAAPVERLAFVSTDPGIVVVMKLGPPVPEGCRLLARHSCNEDVEVHVPTGSNFQQSASVGQAAMDHDEP